MEAAGRTDHRGDLRLAGDRAGTQRLTPRSVSGYAGRGPERSGGAAGGADLVTRQWRPRRRLRWDLIGYGALLGVVVIVIDEVLTRRANTGSRRWRSAWALFADGAHRADPGGGVDRLALRELGRARRQSEFARRMGILTATGLIVGESLFGVAFAGIVAATMSDAPLSVVGEHFETYAVWIGPLVFAAIIAWLYAAPNAPPRNDAVRILARLGRPLLSADFPPDASLDIGTDPVAG